MDPLPTIAIVGKPNVGKSTLFNRLIGKRHAVIAHEAGTTRDRISQKFDCEGYEVSLVDTGGIEYKNEGDIEENIQIQAKLAVADADVILFTVNLAEDLTVDDFSAADILRKSKKNVILVANKCDNAEMEKNIFNIFELGFGEPIAISAIHKLGIEELRKSIAKILKALKFKKSGIKTEKDKEMTNICIMGKPNAGKSSLVNALLGTQKVIVSSIPGTTRDSTDTEFTYEKHNFNLIDTAGLRRRGKIQVGIEKFSSLRAIASVERSDVVVLLIDGHEGISNQDTHIAEHALEGQKGIIIAINKIDLLEKGEDERNWILNRLAKRFAFIPWAPVVFISAKNKTNTRKILEISKEIIEERKKRVTTGELNSFLQKIVFKHLPNSAKAKKPKFLYGSQVDINPPKFVLFFNHASLLHFSYSRYIENEIRKEYGFTGTALNIIIKSKAGPKSKA